MSKQTVNLSLTWELDHEKGIAKATVSSDAVIKSNQFIQGFMMNEDKQMASEKQVTAIAWLLEHFMPEKS